MNTLLNQIKNIIIKGLEEFKVQYSKDLNELKAQKVKCFNEIDKAKREYSNRG